MRLSGGAGRPAKPPRRKLGHSKSYKKTTAAARGRRPSGAELQEQVAALTRELTEAREQQTATADVLKVISRSTFDLQTVLDTLVEAAARLCEADSAGITRARGGVHHHVTQYGGPPGALDVLKDVPLSPGRGSLVGRVLLEGRSVQIPDALADPEYAMSDTQELMGFRTLLGVPLLREGHPIGVINLWRTKVRPFTDKQIALVTTFADQAVIAIENARLFEEVQARTRELTESLQQQTATSEILSVISTSLTDVQPVFETIVRNAVSLCGSLFANVFRFDGELLHFVASHNVGPSYVGLLQAKYPMRPDSSQVSGRVLLTKSVVRLEDALADSDYDQRFPLAMGWRRMLGVPMLRQGDLLGALVVGWAEPGPVSKTQEELLKQFADQAVIAIENVRLFEEVQARTRELTASLQQQTATADVLKVISRSPFDLQTVLDTLVEAAARLCEADRAGITRSRGGVHYHVTQFGGPPGALESIKDLPLPPGRGSLVGRVLLEGRSVQIPDALADPEYAMWDFQKVMGFRTLLGVPLLREGNPIGVIILWRTKVLPFTDNQIDLVETFADQAVIAIENVRLFEEVQARTRELTEALRQQTATADVLKVISRSAFDLPTVLQTLVESATGLCDADKATIIRRKGAALHITEAYGFSQEFMEAVKDLQIEPTLGTASGRALLEGRTVHIPDVEADPDYTFTAKKLGDYRTILAVPMLREGEAIGVLVLTRPDVRLFTDKQIETASTFADQAAIAIENVRLFDSVEARTRELAKSLEDLRTAQDRLVQTEKLASLGQLTAGIAHEIKNPLNFVNNFSALAIDLIGELEEKLQAVRLENEVNAQITELADMLKGNLGKVVEHGKRADLIVKNMLLHSRQESGEHRPVGVNALVAESLNLAYHGARAAKQGFNITLEQSLDPAAGKVDVFPQEIIRVLLNLISNGFYAATKRKAEANSGDYEPTLTAMTKDLGDSVEIRIRDNGTGIPAEVRDKMFNPFFTTKPPGEGTGLGLSLSYDIIVKQHGGSIEVDTQPGEFTEFKIVLPRTAASVAPLG